MQKLNSSSGFTLIELVIIIIIIAIITAVAMVNMTSSFDTARHEHTKAELDALAFAIVGNPALYTNGARSDFGYVGLCQLHWCRVIVLPHAATPMALRSP